MIRRPAAAAGFEQKLGYHVFRAAGITAFLAARWHLMVARNAVSRFNSCR
jgi:hypothetical protein